jgi:hypothetical protein
MPHDFYYKPGFNFEGEPKTKSDSIFNLINDKENLNRINKIANEGVNHIVAAYFIKSVQQSRAAKSDLPSTRRSSVPVNSVTLQEDNSPQEVETNSSANLLTSKAKEVDEIESKRQSQSQNENSKFHNGLNFNTSMFNDKYSSDVNEFTNNQLNTVHDVVKKLKENKISEMVEIKEHQHTAKK